MEKTKKNSTFWSNLFKAPPERSDLEEVLLYMPTFKRFTQLQLKNLLQIVHNRAFTAGEYVFYQNDPGIALYIIRNGEIKIIKSNDDGNEVELTRCSRGDFFGELALLDNDIRSASAIAVTDTNVAVIFKPDLDRFIEKYPKKGNQILRGLSQIIATRLRILDEEYLSLYSKSIISIEEEQNG